MDRRELLAEDAWFIIAVITLPIGALLGMAGLFTLVGAVFVIGWFLLTPLLLFWGEEIAAWYYGPEPAEDAPSRRDPIDELKHRYATGDLSDEEFEHRLSVLLESDEAVERRLEVE